MAQMVPTSVVPFMTSGPPSDFYGIKASSSLLRFRVIYIYILYTYRMYTVYIHIYNIYSMYSIVYVYVYV